VSGGAKIRFRAECPVHGSFIETESRPKEAWCARCGGKAIPITSGTKSGRSVGTNL
jgi:hypothetical protein